MPNHEIVRAGQWQEPSVNFWRAYEGRSAVCFFDSSPETPWTNHNHHQAFEFVRGILQARPGVSVGVFSGMGAGKSTVAYMITINGNLEGGVLDSSVEVFKHEWDRERYGDNLHTQGGLVIEGVRTFFDFDDLEKQAGETRADTLVIEEIQFAGQTQEDPRKIEAFLKKRREEGRKVVFTGLDFDFRRGVWPNSTELIRRVDNVIVLAARCAEPNCGQPAHFTMRRIEGRPAHYDDPAVMVGSVEDTYMPVCASHHRVLPPRGKG